MNIASTPTEERIPTLLGMARIHYEIPDDLHRRAKAAAALRGITLKDLIIDALRRVVDDAEGGHRAVPVPGDTGLRRSSPAWSPDGTRLAGQAGFSMGIVLYSLRTGKYERLNSVGEWPVFLPDGRHILFVSEGKRLVVMDTETRETRTIFSVERDVIGPPRLTRDGRSAYFSRRVTEGDIWLVELERDRPGP